MASNLAMTADSLKRMLFQADLQEQFQTWDAWGNLVRDACRACDMFGLAEPFASEYAALIAARDREGFLAKLIADQMDNYILASIALTLIEAPHDAPTIAYAAQNKRLYQGWHGEIANLRTLCMIGADVNARTLDSGATALHAMCSLKWHPGIHVRAVRILLEAGADPNTKNNIGDSAFAYVCGSWPWTEEVHAAATMMLDSGADPHQAATDGSTALSTLKTNQAERDASGARQSLIDLIELKYQAGAIKPVSRSAPRL